MAHVYSSGTALPSTGMAPRALFAPQAIAQFNPLQRDHTITLRKPVSASLGHSGAEALVARVLSNECMSGCDRVASAVGVENKSRLHVVAANRPVAHTKAAQSRFDKVVAAAGLSSAKLAAAFALAPDAEASALPDGDRFAPTVLTAAISDDEIVPASAERFGARAAQIENGYLLALAIPDQQGDDVAGLPSDTVATVMSDESIALPEPDAVPLPSRRPAGTAKPVVEDIPAVAAAPLQKPAVAPAVKPQLAKAVPAPAPSSRRDAPVELAYAPADDGAGGVGKAFKNLFNGGQDAPAGKGVAVYNISAGTVTMPDGQVLEAHSGIGNMADNPKFVGAKMRGPTPPDTYKLRMRETRFHGVEAIRMLPVDGKVKHGRTGLLAHSELLRGRKGQSHGCVAFKDYNRFLMAFKKGKITHMVVIAGNGRGKGGSTTVASNGPVKRTLTR